MALISLLPLLVIAVACAWVVERTAIPAPQLWRALLVAPLAVPAFVNGYAWVSLTHAVEGYLGAVLIVSLSYFPFIYLPVTASLQRIDPAFEETARKLVGGRYSATDHNTSFVGFVPSSAIPLRCVMNIGTRVPSLLV